MRFKYLTLVLLIAGIFATMDTSASPVINLIQPGLETTANPPGGKPKSSKSEKAVFGKSKHRKKGYQRSIKRHNKRMSKGRGNKNEAPR